MVGMMGYQFVRQLEILPKGVDNTTTQYATVACETMLLGVHHQQE
jgi:hypothetical protein